MTDTGADSTYSDDQIYRLVRRIMAEPKAIRQGSRLLLQRARRRSSDRHPGAGVRRELSFDEVLQKIRGDIGED